MKGNRTVSIGIAAVLTTSAIIGIKTQSAHAAPPQTASRKAEEQFKNIQTLKGIPADELVPTMQFISASLGVQCDFCHVQGAFEKDDKKPKQTARKMMEMMFAINKDSFEGNRKVTCYSCHGGNVHPVGMPVVMAEEPKEPMGGLKKLEETREANGPSADQLFDKFVQASGGAAAIEGITSRLMKGTISFSGRSQAIEIYSKDPEKRISLTHMSEGDNVTAFNGQEGWLGMVGRPMHEMHGSELDGAAIDADLHLPTHLKLMFNKLEVRGTEKIGDHEAYFVVGHREAKTPIQLYFDVQSGLLLRMVRFGETALGQLPTQIDYADYRDANSVKVAYKWTLARPSGRFTIQVSELQQNVPVDDAKFVKPAAPPEPPKK